MSLPTRSLDIPVKEKNDLLSSALVVTVLPKEEEHAHLLSRIGYTEFRGMLKSHSESLEGVLQFSCPIDFVVSRPESTMHYLIVFHQAGSSEEMSERLSCVSGQKQIEFPEAPDESGSLPFFIFESCYVKAHTDEAYKMWLNSLLLDVVSKGGVRPEIGNWHANPEFAYFGPDSDPSPISTLKDKLAMSSDDTLKEIITFVSQECKKRSLEVLTSDPTPSSPFPGPNPLNSTIDLKDLGTTLANANAQLIQDLAGKGVLKTTPPKFHHFTGRKDKADVSFEIWEHDIRMALKTHTHLAVRDSIKQSLQGEVLETVVSLGESATVDEILNTLRPSYSETQSYDTLLQEFFRLQQTDNEEVGEYAIRLNSKLAKIKRQYPLQFTPEIEEQYKRNRLFHGLYKELRDSLRSIFRDSSVSYNDFLAQARSIQREIQDEKALESKFPSSTKTKAKVASTFAFDSSNAQSNSSSGDEQLSLDKLAQAVVACEKKQAETQKLVLDMSKILDDIRKGKNGNGNGGNGSNNSRGRGRGGSRGGRNGNNGRGGYGNTGGNGSTEGQNRNQYQGRGPNCFHCVRLKKERTDHWPQNCQTLKADLDEYHKIQSGHGHQDKHLNT